MKKRLPARDVDDFDIYVVVPEPPAHVPYVIQRKKSSSSVEFLALVMAIETRQVAAVSNGDPQLVRYQYVFFHDSSIFKL